MLDLMKRFMKEEEGLELVEYAVMAALLVVGLILAITTMGDAIADQFNSIGDTIDEAGTGNLGTGDGGDDGGDG